MPINRESIITVLRSIGGNIPDGLTFGEFGFAGANRQLFIGGTGGNQAVESIWIGASITGGDISTSDGWAGGTGAYRVSTTDAVKRYVDAIAGTKGEVASINGDTGIITITGAGNSAAVSVRSTVEGTHLIDARIATNTGVTGVASFSSAFFNVGTTGVVTLKNVNDAIYVQGNSGTKSTVTLGATLGLSGVGSIRTISTSDGFDGIDVTFDNRVATSSLTGVASFDPRHFAIGLSGHVSLTGSIGADSVRMASATVTGAASFDPRHFAIGLSGHVSLTGTYQVTGDTVVAGNSISVVRSNNQVTVANTGVTGIGFGANDTGLTGKITLTGAGGAGGSQFVTVSGNTVTLDNRIATASLTGVASFPSPYFTVSTTGAVNLTTAYSVTGDTVVAGNSISVVRSNNQVTVANTGVTGIGFGANDTGLTGKMTLTGAGGAGGSLFVTVSGKTVTLDNRVATSSLTGVASFPSPFFTVSLTGAVNLATGYSVTGDTIASPGANSSQVVTRSGNKIDLDNKLATINGQTGVAAFTSNFQISSNGTVDLANDVTIAGNLTVQGTVVTSNVDNFTVQDTLIKLGTGNTNVGSAYDLGLYMQYPAAGTNNIRLAGFFLDYQDTKFKLFTGLTASAQDGTTGTDQAAQLHADRQGYTVATLIAKLDGGTF